MTGVRCATCVAVYCAHCDLCTVRTCCGFPISTVHPRVAEIMISGAAGRQAQGASCFAPQHSSEMDFIIIYHEREARGESLIERCVILSNSQVRTPMQIGLGA